MDAHLTEWLNLGIRWIHMIVGIAWIGASFYFVWLENNLNRSNPREGLSGTYGPSMAVASITWRNTSSRPHRCRRTCTGSREAYTTWLSGVALLMVVYYLNPGLYLIAPVATCRQRRRCSSVSAR